MDMESYSVPLWEVMLYGIYLGSVAFLGGVLVFAILCRKMLDGSRKWLRIVMLSSLRLVVSIILFLPLWFYWPAPEFIMGEDMLYPALVTEVLTVSLFYLLLKRRAERKKI